VGGDLALLCHTKTHFTNQGPILFGTLQQKNGRPVKNPVECKNIDLKKQQFPRPGDLVHYILKGTC
jgi:hypothetical protein